MPRVIPSPIGEQDPRAVAPQYQSPASGDFGQVRAAELMAASRDLDRGSASFGNLAVAMQTDATETRAQELNNEFISRQQKLLSTGDDAFYRRTGADAIAGAEAATERLQSLKAELLDRDDVPPAVRKRLAPLLDLHVNAASHGITRHVARESMTWRNDVMTGRRTALHRQAAIDAADPAQIRTLALIGQDLAREKARQDGLAGSDAETALVIEYRSGVLRTAIETGIARDDAASATRLFDRFNAALSDPDRTQLERSIGTLKVTSTARTFAASVAQPALDDASDEGPPGFANFPRQRTAADAWHADAQKRNETGFASNPVQFAANKQAIDARHASTRRALDLEETKLRGEIETWTMQPGPDGAARTERPQPALWNKLSYAQQQSLDAALIHNARGIDAPWTPDAATAYARLNDLALADPQSFAREDLHQYVPLLPKVRLAELLSLRTTIEKDGRVPYEVESTRTMTRRALARTSIDADPALVGEVDARVTDWAASFEAVHKRKPTEAEVREQIDEMVIPGIVRLPTVPTVQPASSPAGGMPSEESPPMNAGKERRAQSSMAIAAITNAAPLTIGNVASRIASPTMGTGSQVAEVMGSVASRMVPAAATATSSVLGALPFLFIPTNSQAEEVELGEGLRARMRPGQRSVEIERRTEKGVFGTNIGAKWERLDVQAEIHVEPNGQPMLRVDEGQLQEIIGAAEMSRLRLQRGTIEEASVARSIDDAVARAEASAKKKPSEPEPPLLPIPLIPVTWTRDGGKTVKREELSREEIEKFCRAYPKVQEAADVVVAKLDSEGMPRNQPVYGTKAHGRFEDHLSEWAGMEGELKRLGIKEFHLEQGFLHGEIGVGTVKRGTQKIDVVEILERDTVCIYDLKTGRRGMSDRKAHLYMGELVEYLRNKGYANILVFEVRPHSATPPGNR